MLLPGLAAGIGLSFLILRFANPHFVALLMAAVTLAFTGLWFVGGGQVRVRQRSLARGAIAGTAFRDHHHGRAFRRAAVGEVHAAP